MPSSPRPIIYLFYMVFIRVGRHLGLSRGRPPRHQLKIIRCTKRCASFHSPSPLPALGTVLMRRLCHRSTLRFPWMCINRSTLANWSKPNRGRVFGAFSSSGAIFWVVTNFVCACWYFPFDFALCDASLVFGLKMVSYSYWPVFFPGLLSSSLFLISMEIKSPDFIRKWETCLAARLACN